jgi:hypothetical protein
MCTTGKCNAVVCENRCCLNSHWTKEFHLDPEGGLRGGVGRRPTVTAAHNSSPEQWTVSLQDVWAPSCLVCVGIYVIVVSWEHGHALWKIR